MTGPVEQIAGAVEHEDTIKISWHFKANLSELASEGVTLKTHGPLALPGSWELELRHSHDSDFLRLSFQHGSLPIGAFGKSVVVKLRFALVLGTEKRLLHEQSWNDGPEPSLAATSYKSYGSYWLFASRSKLAANGRWTTSEQNSVQQYCATLVFERDLQLDTARSHNTPTADVAKAEGLAGTLHTRHADVCLRFRRPDDAYLELWTTSGMLATASDYYKTLLASGCAETVPSGSQRQRSEAPPSIKQEDSRKIGAAQLTMDWQDSDDEMDDFLVERDWSGCKTASRDSTDVGYQQIDVRETAYSTMNAVLLYLMTGHIEFAPLSSLLVTLDEDGPSTRLALLDTHVSEHPTLPPPVSPKSVYRLAHLLQREELQQLALDALSNSLTIEGAARELFSPVSIAYADVKKVIIGYVDQNWQKVQASESWTEMREKVMAGEIEGAAQVLFDLLGVLHGKDSTRAGSEPPA